MADGSRSVIDAALTPQFALRMRKYPPKNRKKILAFIKHLQEEGFDGLEGRCKQSDDVSPDIPSFVAIVRFVRQHHLWHYHIGIHRYEPGSDFGDRTSMFILHFCKPDENFVRVVHMSPHPPFEQPTIDMVTYTR